MKLFILFLIIFLNSCVTAYEGSTIKYEPHIDTKIYKDYNVDTNTDTDLSVDFSKNTNK